MKAHDTEIFYSLNIESDLKHPWGSPTATNVERYRLPEWFEYYKNLESESIPQNATKYFESIEVNLENLVGPDGIWASLDGTAGELGFPEFSFAQSGKEFLKEFSVSFYAHAEATLVLTLEGDDQEVIEINAKDNEEGPIQWTNFTIPVLGQKVSVRICFWK
jgi:hypothetical protein